MLLLMLPEKKKGKNLTSKLPGQSASLTNTGNTAYLLITEDTYWPPNKNHRRK